MKNIVFEQYRLLMLNRYPELQKSVRDNRKFKKTHKNERCFILGNGPSLKSIDLGWLEKEFVFTVNFFTEIDGFEKAGTNVHLWTDPNLFKMQQDAYTLKEQRRFQENYRKIAESGPVCFVPAGAYPYVKKHRLDQMLDIHYLVVAKTFEGCKMNHIDLCRGIYGCTTVVQFAIQTAIYMGFREIYLLGCDSTNIFTFLETILGKDIRDRHAYCSRKQEQSRETGRFCNTSFMLYDQYLLFLGYERLNQYCSRHGIKLRNASQPTLITGVGKADIKKILL